MEVSVWATLMAEYNQWMNQRIYTQLAEVSDEERKRDRGAFFGSLHRTLDHLIWADRAFLGRLSQSGEAIPPIEEPLFEEFAPMRNERERLDARILEWAQQQAAEQGDQILTIKSRVYQRTFTPPAWMMVAQMFNHQTHHRGQVHAMMTSMGIDVGPTDLPVSPYALRTWADDDTPPGT